MLGVEQLANLHSENFKFRKTYIQSFEDLCAFVNNGETVYFQTNEVCGSIELKHKAQVLITVASEEEVDYLEGTLRKLQNIYFYLRSKLFLLTDHANTSYQ